MMKLVNINRTPHHTLHNFKSQIQIVNLTYQGINCKFNHTPFDIEYVFLHFYANENKECSIDNLYLLPTVQGRADRFMGPRSISWTGPLHYVKVNDMRKN